MENTTQNQVETAVQTYINEQGDQLENLIRHAFLAGYGAGLDAAQRIYNPSSPTASTSL